MQSELVENVDYKLKYENLVAKITKIQNKKLNLDIYKKYVLKMNNQYIKDYDFYTKKVVLAKNPEQLQLFDSVEVYLFCERNLLDEVEIIEYPKYKYSKIETPSKISQEITLEVDELQCGIITFYIDIDYYDQSKQKKIILYNEEYSFELTEYIPEIEEMVDDLGNIVCICDCGKNKIIYQKIIDVILEKKVICRCSNGVVNLPLHKLKKK